MKLFLASEAKNEKNFPKLQEFVGGFEGKSIAYIPTAWNGELEFESWKISATWNLVNSVGANITAVQLEDFKNESVIRELENKDIIWFAGGYATYLMYWMIRCNIDTHIRRLLQKSIYVGSSAGSMIASHDLKIETWHSVESNRTGNMITGLGLVEFDIYPHYRDDELEYIKQHYKGNNLYLLKDGEAVIVDGDNISVFGEERIIKN
jgi:dipeptidase E